MRTRFVCLRTSIGPRSSIREIGIVSEYLIEFGMRLESGSPRSPEESKRAPPRGLRRKGGCTFRKMVSELRFRAARSAADVSERCASFRNRQIGRTVASFLFETNSGRNRTISKRFRFDSVSASNSHCSSPNERLTKRRETRHDRNDDKNGIAS